MLTPSLDRITILQKVEEGQYQAIDQAKEAGILNNILFDIVERFNMRTGGMLMRAVSFGADLSQRRESDNSTLLHVLAQSRLHILNTRFEKNEPIEKDYYKWAIEPLLKYGLSFNDTNFQGKTPIQIAQKVHNMAFLGAVEELSKVQQPNDLVPLISVGECKIS